MPESFNDYFDSNTQWTEGGASATGPTPPAPPRSRRDMRRKRVMRRRKRLITVIAALLVVFVVAVCAVFGYRQLVSLRQSRQDVSKPLIEDWPGPGTGKVEFTVSQGEGTVALGKRLVKAEVVKSVAAFTSVVEGNTATIYPGTYDLRRHMSAEDVVSTLSDPTKATGFVDVRSGERVDDVIRNVAAVSGIDESEFRKIVDGGGKGILPAEANGKFEGWLEPGQYDAKSTKDASLLLKERVDRRVAKLDQLKVPDGAERERILEIASIAEAEVNSPEYYGKVVRVILNRLDKGMPLGMDTTVAYGLGIKASELTNAQLNDASNRYNTRINKGLPPTPISNPGDNALRAALDPDQGDWLYFVTTDLKTGETKFTDNEQEFQKFVQEYKGKNPDGN